MPSDRIAGGEPHLFGDEPIKLLDGRFGPYVTDGETNASLPRGTDPETLTFEAAVQLLAERLAKGGGKKKKAAKKTAKKAAKKTTTKKATKKKTPAKKATKKKAAE